LRSSSIVGNNAQTLLFAIACPVFVCRPTAMEEMQDHANAVPDESVDGKTLAINPTNKSKQEK
jgi:hypothetical protein